MKSPFTDKDMELKIESRSITFRKEKFEILYHYYYCSEFDEQITNPQLEEININQVYNQYRSKYNLPFPDEIREIREKYHLTASKMSTLLGFGINTYKSYENGEVPSESNAKLIQLARDPFAFKSIIHLNHDFFEGNNTKISKRIDQLITEESEKQQTRYLIKYIFGEDNPTEFSGFRTPNINIMTEMVVYFVEKLSPHKELLNQLLFYADFLQYKKSCYSISGSKYHKMKDIGPVPDNANTLFEYIYNNKDIDIIFDKSSNWICEKFVSTRKFKKDLFDVSQLETLDIVAKNFGNSDCTSRLHDPSATMKFGNDQDAHLSYNLGFELCI